jgi:hypothetical protein
MCLAVLRAGLKPASQRAATVSRTHTQGHGRQVRQRSGEQVVQELHKWPLESSRFISWSGHPAGHGCDAETVPCCIPLCPQPCVLLLSSQPHDVAVALMACAASANGVCQHLPIQKAVWACVSDLQPPSSMQQMVATAVVAGGLQHSSGGLTLAQDPCSSSHGNGLAEVTAGSSGGKTPRVHELVLPVGQAQGGQVGEQAPMHCCRCCSGG